MWLLPGSVEFGDRRSFASGAVFRNFIGFAQFVVTLLELFHRSLVGRIVNDVFHLHGILFHVKEHPFVAGPDVGKRVAVRPDAVVARGVVFAGIFVKTVVNATEQLYKDLDGAKKLEKAKENIIALLNEKGITITELEMDMMIEEVVNGFNQGLKKEGK